MVVVKIQRGWYDRTGSIQYPDIKSVLPRKYVKAINNITAPTELLSAKGVINRNSIHTGPERDRLIPIKLQLGPGVEIIGGCDTPHTPSFAPLVPSRVKSRERLATPSRQHSTMLDICRAMYSEKSRAFGRGFTV